MVTTGARSWQTGWMGAVEDVRNIHDWAALYFLIPVTEFAKDWSQGGLTLY